MNVTRFKPNLPALVFGVWAVLLLLAAVLLYRWINRAHEADRKQHRELLVTALRSCATEFNSAVQEVLTAFRPAPRLQNDLKLEHQAVDLYQPWRDTARHSALIGSLSIGSLDAQGKPFFRRAVTNATGAIINKDTPFASAEWPAALAAFQQRLPAPADNKRPPLASPSGYALLLTDERPVLALPLLAIHVGQPEPGNRPSASFGFGPPWARGGFGPPNGARPGPPPDQMRQGPPPDQMRQGPPPWVLNGQAPPWSLGAQARRQRMAPGQAPRLQLAGWCFVEFDAEYLLQRLLPELLQHHFSGAELSQYRIEVTRGDSSQVLFRSETSLTAPLTADATETLLSSSHRLGTELESANASREWRLVAQHRAGSLEAVLHSERRQNLLIGFGLLSLLFGSVALLVVTTQRARNLAQRQLEFVAGVSHELRTPLSVIQSAGFNLASGRVADAARVKQYGATIQHEGQRLSEMVEQMLTFAGIQAGRKHYHFQPVHLPALIESALAEYEPAFIEQGWQIEQDIAADLPAINGDAQALESAIKNLLHNALKYAALGQWLRLSAQPHDDEIQLTVADHGPGIATEDLRNLFEPFYRGQGMAASSIAGAGLGLSIMQEHIKAHGGRISVETAPDQGAAFTIHLPVLNGNHHA
ncbi:MAG: hypothetical protein HOP19_04530 [Acidobacteria bacterium]|nr:hypothetical protein [Acidobacteriota bacterium]